MKRILITEDSSVVQNLTKKILQDLGYDVSGVKSANDTLSKLQKEEFHLVLLDLHLPGGGDGMEVVRAIRQQDSTRTLPVIAITGNAKGYTPQQFQEAGFDHFLSKPLNYDRLVDLVRSYLG